MSVSKPHCPRCGEFHWGQCASNAASNVDDNASNAHLTASNGEGRRLVGPNVVSTPPLTKPTDVEVSQTAPRSATGTPEGIEGAWPSPSGAVKQRWSRESYNAYMREYMKRRRKR